MLLSGCYVALVTPFKEDRSLDLYSYEKLIEYCIEGGVAGLVPCGTTGELATLSESEHKELIKIAVRKKEEVSNKNKIEVIAGAGSNCTEKAIHLSLQAQDLGADGVLQVIPYYNKPTQAGIYEHIKKIAESIKIPLVLYNVPSRTVVSIAQETLLSLSEISNVVGIKEASADIRLQSKMLLGLQDRNQRFKLLSGDDFTLLATLSIGGEGIISVVANIAPGDVVLLIKNFKEGRNEEAKRLHYKLFPLIESLFIETNPAPVKEALYMLGIIKEAQLRLPLVRVSNQSREYIKNALKSYGFNLVS